MNIIDVKLFVPYGQSICEANTDALSLQNKGGNPTCGFPSFSFAEIHPFGRFWTIGHFALCGGRQGAPRPLMGGHFLKKVPQKLSIEQSVATFVSKMCLKNFQSSTAPAVFVSELLPFFPSFFRYLKPFSDNF